MFYHEDRCVFGKGPRKWKYSDVWIAGVLPKCIELKRLELNLKDWNDWIRPWLTHGQHLVIFQLLFYNFPMKLSNHMVKITISPPISMGLIYLPTFYLFLLYGKCMVSIPSKWIRYCYGGILVNRLGSSLGCLKFAQMLFEVWKTYTLLQIKGWNLLVQITHEKKGKWSEPNLHWNYGTQPFIGSGV